MKHQWINGSIWLLMLMVMPCSLQANVAGANSGGNNQSLAVKNDLLQFKAGSHVMGFKPDKAYLVNTTSFLSVEFLGAHTIVPQAVAADDANRHQNDVALTPDHEDTLANLQRVEYQNLWNGITLRYDAVQTGIAESTYFIQPGADIADIRLKYNADTELQEDGSLKIKLATQQGYITESMPVAWQMVDGRKKAVEVAYEIHDGTIGFKTGAYNKDQNLIIDPTYQWHTFHGSTSIDEGYSIAVDGSGNVYITGMSYATWGAPLHAHDSHAGYPDIVVLKLDSSGALVWNTFYGGQFFDRGYGIVVDGSSNVYVTGYSVASWGTPVNAHTSGSSDIVVLKLNSSGVYQWHTFHGSESDDKGQGITLDESGYAYITGQSEATWGSPLNAHSAGSNYDIVTFKLDRTTGVLQWNTFNGSTLDDYSYGIAIGSGNIYVTGQSEATWGTPGHAFSGGNDIVVLKLNSSGALAWNTFHGSTYYDDYGYGIAVDGGGNVYVTGKSYSTWGSPVNPYSDNSDIVVLKLDSSGTLAWNTFHGSTYPDEGKGIAVDGTGNVYISGSSQKTWGSPLHAYNGFTSYDIVALKLNSSGAYQWHTFYGSTSTDYGNGIAVDGNENIYVAGSSNATWDTPVNPYTGTGNADILIFMLDNKSTLTITKAGTGLGTVTSTPPGIDCGTDCIETYVDQSTITLTATPDPKFTFAGWSGDCIGKTNETSVLIDGNKSCTATFKKFPWPMFIPAIIKGGVQ